MLYEKAPPGREDQVKALKRKYGERAAYAIAWASYNKSKGKDVKESYTQYFGDSAKVTGSSHKVGDRVKTHDGLVGKVTKVSKSHVEVRGHPYQHADVKKIKTGQEKADEVASAMDKLRQHLRSKGFKSVRKEEVNEVFGRIRDKLGPMNAFHKTGKTSESGYDHSSQGHVYHGQSSTGAHVTSSGGRDVEKAAEHIRRGFLAKSKDNRDKFKKHMDHVDTTQHADGSETDTFKDKAGVHYDAHHDPETGTVHVSRTKSRTRTEEVVSEEGDAPTNSMGSSASDPNTGNVQGVSPLLGKTKKRKELEKHMKESVAGWWKKKRTLKKLENLKRDENIGASAKLKSTKPEADGYGHTNAPLERAIKRVKGLK